MPLFIQKIQNTEKKSIFIIPNLNCSVLVYFELFGSSIKNVHQFLNLIKNTFFLLFFFSERFIHLLTPFLLNKTGIIKKIEFESLKILA